MGQNLSTVPATPHFSTPLKSKSKGRRHTAETVGPLPKRAKSLAKRHTLDEQLAARYMAEEKLEGRSPRLIIIDTAASPQWGKADSDEEVEGLRINVDGRRLDRPRTTLDSTVSSLYKFPPPFARSTSGESLSFPASSRTAVDDQPGHSPTSHWSESSAGVRTPPQTFQSFRESDQFHAGPGKRLSGISATTAARSSNILNIDEAISSTKPIQKAIEKSLNSYRTNKENERKRKAAKKRGPIVVVGAQRVGSGRYSMMKEAAVRSAAARRESLAPMEDVTTRRGSKDGQGRRSSSASESRRADAGRRASAPTHAPSDSPTRPALSSRRSSSHSNLMSFIAASPDLTCPDPNRPLFELQATPRPSIARLPAGHPGNHHSRFRAYNERVAALPPPPSMPDNLSGPVVLPPRGVLSQRRPSNPSSSARSSIISLHPPSGLQNEVAAPEPTRRPSTASINSRKLSGYRLSIAEPREGDQDDDDDDAESRRGSVNSWATTSRSRMNSTELTTSSVKTDAGSGSAGSNTKRRSSSVSLSALVSAPERRRSSAASVPFAPPLSATRSGSVTSRASFPHSVAYTSDSGRRRGSAVSYFTLPSSHPDLPQSPDSLPSNTSEALRTPRPADMGAISWDGYSLTTPPALQPRNSVTSLGGSDIAPETVDAFPLPPSIPRLRVHAPSPLVLSSKEHQPFPYDTESSDLVLSDVSTPSTASFGSSTGTSVSSQGGKFIQRDAQFDIGTGEGFSHMLSELSSGKDQVKITLDPSIQRYKAPSSPIPSLGAQSATTFTMDDLAQLGGNSWSPPATVRTADLPQPSSTVASFPVISSSPVEDPAPISIARRRPSEHQLETASPSLALPSQPIPSPTNKRAPPPVFSDWKIRIDSTAAQIHRLPTVVSPGTNPFTSEFMEDSDDEDEEDEGDVTFSRVVVTPMAAATRIGLVGSFLDCSPSPPVVPTPTEEPQGLGFEVSRPVQTDRGLSKFRQYGLGVDSPRRGTHPMDWTPPSMRKSAGLEALVEKNRSASEDHGVARLGSLNKRGFNKVEVSDWLSRASRETVSVVRPL